VGTGAVQLADATTFSAVEPSKLERVVQVGGGHATGYRTLGFPKVVASKADERSVEVVMTEVGSVRP